MSLFDVIKYPVSNPPTSEQLNALPDAIYNKWRTWWLTTPIDTPMRAPISVKYLRNFILEYNNESI